MISIALLLFGIFTFCIFDSRNYNNKSRFLFFIFLLFVVAAFRNGDGLYDYAIYVESFNDYENRIIEPTFLLFSHLIHQLLNGEVLYLFLIYSFLAITFKYYAIKELSVLLIPSLYLYLCNFYIAQEWIQIRSGVAAGLLLLSVKAVFDRNLMKFLFLVLLAALFHVSALMFLIVYIFNPSKISKIACLLIFMLSYLCYFIHVDFLSVLRWAAFIDIIDSKLNAYENIAIGTANVFSIAQIIKVCVTFFLLYNVEKIQLYNKYAIILLKIMLLSLCVLPLFASDAVAGTRIRDLFGTVEFILFTY